MSLCVSVCLFVSDFVCVSLGTRALEKPLRIAIFLFLIEAGLRLRSNRRVSSHPLSLAMPIGQIDLTRLWPRLRLRLCSGNGSGGIHVDLLL